MHLSQLDSGDTPQNNTIIVAAGEWLVSLCSSPDLSTKDQLLSPLERLKFDEFFTLHRQSPIFKKYHVEAVRRCLAKAIKPDYRLACALLEKDDSHRLFVNENDVLQVAIKTARKQPGYLGQSVKDSCPELVEMVELLMAHGASASSVDDDGNSALFYTCVLGYDELFHVLVSAGADISTTHRRQLPEQLKKSDSESKDSPTDREQDAKVNLLQVTLDALISPQRITDMTWVGWPPGVNYDRPLWEGDPKSTWGGIILYLLQQGLSYAKDDPGLIMILHIACYQGHLDLVEQLLSFGVATDVGGSRIVDGGQGKGSTLGSAMHAAAAGRQLSVVSILLAHGVSSRFRRKCIFNRARTNGELTPLEVAKSSSPNVDGKQFLDFLERFTQHGEELEESDYQTTLKYYVIRNHFDSAKRLLQGGVRLPEIPASIKSVEMAKLLLSHDISLDPAALQGKAMGSSRFNLLCWCVSEYGPLLPSDPESWGEMASRLLNSGNIYIDSIKYLLTEYPGPHIDAVVIAELRLPDMEKEEPTPTSWLHMAILKDNITAIRMLLEAGADPSCPGLPFDAFTTMRSSKHNLHRSIPQRLEIIHTLEKRKLENGEWTPPTYEEIMSHVTKTVAMQKRKWGKRLKKMAARRQDVPCTEIQHALTSTALSHIIDSNEVASYPPLSGTSAFRLLELQPSDSRTAPLVGRLVDSDITFQPDYEALSYVWGDITPVKYIRLDEHDVSLTPNLHSALTHLRSLTHVRTLWVDALCINQSAYGERNQQVRIMGDIYKSARQVVVWLGDAADGSHLVFAHLNDDDIKDSFINRPTAPEPQRRAWNAIVRRPWFYRTWVIQEIARARRATIMCGEDSTLWRNVDQSWKADFSGGAKGLSTVHSAPGNQPDHPLSGFDADSHVWRLRLLDFRSDPLSILRYSRVCQTTEVKDKIYGIVGLFEPGFIDIDYDLPVEDIFQQFTEAVIRLTGDLRIFKYLGVARNLEGVSSWVPDFTDTSTRGLPEHHWYAPYRSGALDHYNLRFADGTTSFVPRDDLAKRFLPGLDFVSGGGVVIKGKMIDTIRDLGFELPDGMSYAPGTDNFARIMREWETLAATLIVEWKDSLGPSVTKAFGATLASSRGSEIHSIDIGFTEWYRCCGTGILEAKDPSMFIRDHEFYMWWLSVGKDNNDKDPDEIDFDLREFSKQMEYASYGRCLFTTEKGSMGLASSRASAGDCIVYFPGVAEPFVLRRREDETGWTMVNDCYLYGLNLDMLFYDEEHLVEDFVIY
ncbi:Fc.00g010600.m01.CDS01 [Cosmosporella sp. VM-42]